MKNVLRYAIALRLDVGKFLSDLLAPYLTEEKPKP